MTRMHEICSPGGETPHIKGVGMLVGNFELKETDLGVAQALFDP